MTELFLCDGLIPLFVRPPKGQIRGNPGDLPCQWFLRQLEDHRKGQIREIPTICPSDGLYGGFRTTERADPGKSRRSALLMVFTAA